MQESCSNVMQWGGLNSDSRRIDSVTSSHPVTVHGAALRFPSPILLSRNRRFATVKTEVTPVYCKYKRIQGRNLPT